MRDDANDVVSARSADVTLAAAPTADTVSGNPHQGSVELGAIGGAEVGIWELRDGTVTDTEIDELFIVISGSAVIEFLDEPAVGGALGPRTIDVGVGDVVRLVAGSRTRWIVVDHIRKVYIAAE